MTALNIKTCPVHGAYSGGFEACPYCGKPFVVSTKNNSGTTRLNESNKPRRINQHVIKPLSATEVAKRLQVAGLHSEREIASGLANGVTANALYGSGTGDSEGVFLAYMALVDSLLAAGYTVAGYRHRVVSGIAA